MNGDIGLFALTIAECERLMFWAGWVDDYEQEDGSDPDYVLFKRLVEWKRRHVEMKARLAEIDAYIARHSEATP